VLISQGIVEPLKLERELNLHEWKLELELKKQKKGKFGEKEL
jgi:hypothetical protein